MSDIQGTGYGRSHEWKRVETTRWKVSYYKCARCGAIFGHAYDNVPDIFEAMQRQGETIPDQCPGAPPSTGNG